MHKIFGICARMIADSTAQIRSVFTGLGPLGCFIPIYVITVLVLACNLDVCKKVFLLGKSLIIFHNLRGTGK